MWLLQEAPHVEQWSKGLPEVQEVLTGVGVSWIRVVGNRGHVEVEGQAED